MNPCVGKKPSVKADLAIYGQVLGVYGWCMKAPFTHKQKVDFSCHADKTGFPRPGHIYMYSLR